MEIEGSTLAQKIFEVDGKHEAADLPELPSHPISSNVIMNKGQKSEISAKHQEFCTFYVL